MIYYNQPKVVLTGLFWLIIKGTVLVKSFGMPIGNAQKVMIKAMKSQSLVGRKAEQQVLQQALVSPEAEFIAIHGRRRVGKTFLIREFFGDAIVFELTGLHGATLREQLANFASALQSATEMSIKPEPPASWNEAFDQLSRVFESIKTRDSNKKRIIFFDELPWLDTPRSKFLSSLEHFWNVWASRRRDLVLVACGSAASWVVLNLIHAWGGLHHRVTRRIQLLPFTLAETEAFLKSRSVVLSRMQVLELYLATGGVPHYLKEASPGCSAAQIIDALCFSSQGLLRTEFADLYRSLFDQSEQHLAIVKALASRQQGLTRQQLISAIGLISGGTTTQRLDELEQCGFVLRTIPFGHRDNDALFRLSDEFTLFHLRWIEPLGRRSPGNGYWLSLRNTPAWRAWSGLAFEGLCLKHATALKHALGISGVHTLESSWFHRPARNSSESGTQIDLLIDRRDGCINLCEMKFSDTAFLIDKANAENLRRKRAIFQQVTQTRKNLFWTMVTTHGIVDNAWSRELIGQTLTLDALFE